MATHLNPGLLCTAVHMFISCHECVIGLSVEHHPQKQLSAKLEPLEVSSGKLRYSAYVASASTLYRTPALWQPGLVPIGQRSKLASGVSIG